MSAAALRRQALILAGKTVTAVVACPNATGGATSAALTVDLKNADGAAVSGIKQVLLATSTTQYAFGPLANGSLTLDTPTKGSIIATLSGCWLIATDVNGQFAAPAVNTDDETVYFWVAQAASISVPATGCIVLSSNCDAAIWSA